MRKRKRGERGERTNFEFSVIEDEEVKEGYRRGGISLLKFDKACCSGILS